MKIVKFITISSILATSFLAINLYWNSSVQAKGQTKIDRTDKGCWKKIRKNEASTNTEVKPIICLDLAGKMVANQTNDDGYMMGNSGLWKMYVRAGRLEILSWAASKDRVFSEHFTSCYYKFEGNEMILSGCELEGYWKRTKERA